MNVSSEKQKAACSLNSQNVYPSVKVCETMHREFHYILLDLCSRLDLVLRSGVLEVSPTGIVILEQFLSV